MSLNAYRLSWACGHHPELNSACKTEHSNPFPISWMKQFFVSQEWYLPHSVSRNRPTVYGKKAGNTPDVTTAFPVPAGTFGRHELGASRINTQGSWLVLEIWNPSTATKTLNEDGALVEFTGMPGESYRRWLRSLSLDLWSIFWALINSLVCWFCSSALGHVLFQICGQARWFGGWMWKNLHYHCKLFWHTSALMC